MGGAAAAIGYKRRSSEDEIEAFQALQNWFERREGVNREAGGADLHTPASKEFVFQIVAERFGDVVDDFHTATEPLYGAKLMGAVRDIRRWTADKRFVGVRVVPWLWDLPPNDRRYYPVYVACIEAGVPFCTQIGHTGPLKRSETGRPLPYLEDVLLDFPELTVVGGHVGAPWIEEVLLLARKFPNFHIDTSAYAVHRLPEALVAFMRGAGRTRVMFGTNWPMLSPERALEKLTDLALDDEARDLFLGGNARRVFKLADLGRS